MGTLTPRARIYKTSPVGEIVTVEQQVNEGFDKIDALLGARNVTSSTRPSPTERFEGQLIRETDTGRLLIWDGADWVIFAEVGPWQSFTPSLNAATTNPNLGTGSLQYGKFQQVGKTVKYLGTLRFGTSGISTGAGAYRIPLPVPRLDQGSNASFVGFAVANDSSAGLYLPIGLYALGSGYVEGRGTGSGNGTTGPTTPWTWAANDSISWNIQYEVA